MKLLILLTICVTCQAGIIPGSITWGHDGTIVQGPSSATNVLGPDGSLVAASAIGGRVAAGSPVGGVVAWAPVGVGHAYGLY